MDVRLAEDMATKAYPAGADPVATMTASNSCIVVVDVDDGFLGSLLLWLLLLWLVAVGWL